jgi:phosphotransferase system  glucose/maltose/N-acetylglucosamine-specific IIC component
LTPAPAGSEPGGFELGPELWLLLLGVLATLIVFAIFVWLIRQMHKEDKAANDPSSPVADAVKESHDD